jgi:hypothetical protein
MEETRGRALGTKLLQPVSAMGQTTGLRKAAALIDANTNSDSRRPRTHQGCGDSIPARPRDDEVFRVAFITAGAGNVPVRAAKQATP